MLPKFILRSIVLPVLNKADDRCQALVFLFIQKRSLGAPCGEHFRQTLRGISAFPSFPYPQVFDLARSKFYMKLGF